MPVMSKLTVGEATSREEWDNYVKSRIEANFLQSWDFYEFHRARGKAVVRRLVRRDDEIVGAYAGVVETAKRGTYMAVAGGPLMDWKDKAVVKAVFADIREQGKKHTCAFVRVRPQLERSEWGMELMRSMGLREAPMYLSVEYAGILDLTRSREEILAGASQGFRRKLRKAEKSDIVVTASDSDEAIAEFCRLEKLHAERQQYVAFSSEWLTRQFEAFRKGGEVLIYTATKDGETLAQNFIIFYGPEASYHYGVSSEAGTRISAAPMLHMAAMDEARRRGCTRYNLWGIVGTDEKSHRFYGVSEFKRSFGSEELKYIPAMHWLVETLRRKLRHV